MDEPTCIHGSLHPGFGASDPQTANLSLTHDLMAILVTGAAGFIGSHTVDFLLNRGTSVVGLDCFDEFYDPRIKERNLARARDFDGFTEIRADLRDREALDALPQDIDCVIHLAARAGVRPSIEDPILYGSVNVVGTLCLLEWMKARGVRDLIFASSSSVYGNNKKVPFSEADPVEEPISPYAASKRAGEVFCHSHHHLYGMSVAALRFFTVYGPRQRPDLAIHKFAALMKDGLPITMFGDGTTERDYTYIDDIIEGVSGSLDLVRQNDPLFEILNLGGSRTVALAEMIRVLGEEMGVEPIVNQIETQPGDVDRTFADVDKAGRLVGYHPRTDFREGIRKFLRWLDEDRQRASRLPS
jgi:UDP-glucuronate 4-epimerase